jgi:hypothetical protein
MESSSKEIVSFESWRGLEKKLCPTCQEMLVKQMTPLYHLQNSSSKFDRARAKIKYAKLQFKLWKKLCPTCLRFLKSEVVK